MHTLSLPCANIFGGKYRYSEDLLKLASMTVPSPSAFWPPYHTPIRINNLSPLLVNHPDQTFVLEGLKYGFRIGFNHAHQPHSHSRNHLSSGLQPHVVRELITSELADWSVTTSSFQNSPCQPNGPCAEATPEQQVLPHCGPVPLSRS